MATTSIHPYRVRRSALRIAAIYAALAFAWISLSDAVIELFVRDVDRLTQIQMVKGSFFVAVTSFVLWLLIKHGMRRLVNSERRYRMLFEAFQDAVFVVTAQGRFRDANNAALALSGYTLDGLRGLKAEQIITQNCGDPCCKLSSSTVAQHTLRAKSGAAVVVEVAVSPLMYNDEAVFAWVARDVSERCQTEEAIQQSEARFRSLFESVPVGIATSHNGVTVSANPAYLSLFGYDDIRELASKSLLEQIAPECRDEIIARNRRREAGEVVPKSYETIGLRKDGTTFPFSVNGTRIDSAEGSSTLVFVTDISGRKQAEMQLRRESARVRALADIARVLAEASMDQQAVLAAITQRTAELFSAPCMMWLLTDDRQQLHPVASYHPDREIGAILRAALNGMPQHAAEGLHSRVLQNGQGVLLPTLPPQALVSIIKPEYVEHIKSFGLHSLMIVPLRVRKYIIGTLVTARSHDQGIYTDADLAFFHELADQAALAVENARLFSASLRELDERKRTEAALAASEERFRSLSASAPIGICFADVHGQCVYTNPHFQIIADLRSDAALGIGWIAVVHPDDRERVLAEWRVCAAKGLEQSTEFRFQRRDGTIRWVRGRYAPMCSDNGVRMGLVGTIEDITERKRMERSLRKSEMLQQAVLEGTTDVVFVKDQDGRYLLMNPAGAAVLGHRIDQIIGKRDEDFFPPEAVSGLRDADSKVLQTGESVEVENTFNLRGREQTFLSVKAPYRDQDGALQGVIGIARDITERKRTERIKDDFLALASHELKTPLATLVGYVHLLQRWSAKNEFGERANHALASMQTEAMRLDRLINDLLDVSRIQTGRLQIHLRTIDLRSHLAHVVNTLQLAIPDHTIVLEDLPDSPLWCHADAQRLEQVLINLLTNAAKYSYEGKPIHIGVRGLAEQIEVTVRDHGIGIPVADLPFIFDRFYQVQRPARESRPGMGLGLYITQEIVRQHGGTLSVESQEEIGSCFTVRLPYAVVMSEEVTSDATSTICPSA